LKVIRSQTLFKKILQAFLKELQGWEIMVYTRERRFGFGPLKLIMRAALIVRLHKYAGAGPPGCNKALKVTFF